MEADEQKEFVAWFKSEYPEHAQSLRCSMNGLKRTGRKQGAKMWNMMKSQGAIPGEADIAILLPKGGYGSFLAEHKGAGMARKLTDEQKSYLEYHQSIGNCAVSTRGIEALKAAIISYMGEV